MLILKNARILPELTPGFAEELADVVVAEGKIAEVLKAGQARAGSGDEALDAAGGMLLPGFIDAHVHLDLCGMNTFEENVQPDAYRVIRALQLAQDNLRKGYTTLRDVGDRNDIVIDLAKAVRDGLCVAPDILASGRILSPTEAGNNFFGDMYLEADSPAEYTRAVRLQRQRGADWIKYMGTGAVMNPGGEPGAPIISEEELTAMVKAADLAGLPVVGHSHGAGGIKMAIRAGVRTIEHSSLMDDECFSLYKEFSHRSFIVPTFSPMTFFTEFPEGLPPHYVEKSRKFHKMMIEGMTRAYKEGLKMGFGTDAGVYAGSHGNGIYEMEARVKYAGITPKDVLIQATRTTAEILMIDDKVGTVEPGKKANLVLINGRPDQDIKAAGDVKAVVKDGRVVNV